MAFRIHVCVNVFSITISLFVLRRLTKLEEPELWDQLKPRTDEEEEDVERD